MMMSHNQAKALAALVNVVRPDWDVNGIIAALGKVRDAAPLDELAAAAIRCAQSAHNRTPAVIALPGDHWKPTRSATAPRPVRGPTCAVCGQPREVCEARWAGDHKFLTLEQARARATRRPK